MPAFKPIQSGAPAAGGMLQVLNLEQTLKREESLLAASTDPLPEVVESGLTAQIRKDWETAKMYRVKTDLRLLDCLRARRGVYSAAELAVMQQKGGANIIWMDIADTKARAASAWISDVVMPAGEQAWSAEHAPIPELPDEIKIAVVEKAAYEARQTMVAEAEAGKPWMSEADFKTLAAEIGAGIRDEALSAMRENATKRAERMEKKIAQHMVEGGYRQAMAEFIDHFVTYPTAVLKGPFFQNKDCMAWLPGWHVAVESQVKMAWAAVNPFDCYPAPNAADCQSGAFIERLRLRREHLYALIGLPGYNEAAIRGALEDYRNGRNESWLWSEMERRRWENDTIFDWLSPHGVIDALHYWGNVPGAYLMQWGMDPEGLDPVKEYAIDAILIGRYVVRAALNGHPLKKRPYHQASFSRVPGAFWGRSLFDLVKSSQKMCNATACSMADNLGMACLTGDTVVYRHEKPGSTGPRRYSQDVEITLDELWERKNRPKSGLKRNRLRSLDEATGKFFGNRVIDIFDNGVRPVHRVTTSRGYSVKATMNHRFMTDDGGYRRLEQMSPGNLIAVNGSTMPARKSCIDCEKPLVSATAIRCRSCSCRFLRPKKERKCMECGAQLSLSATAKRCRACFIKSETWRRWNTKQAHDALVNRDALDNSARSRRLWRDGMLEVCQECGASADLELHHIDRDPLNCAPSNRMTLCSKCHHAWHRRQNNYGNNPALHVYVDFDEIVSIEYVGEERVFDLQMEAPNHNFVANGFVSHNSGPMMWLYTDKLATGFTDINPEPWKIYQLASSKSGADPMTNPGIGFFQTPSNAQELMAVFQFFEDRADTTSGVPKYFSGTAGEMPEVARTVAMLMNAGQKGLRQAITDIDLLVTEPTLQDVYIYEMLYGQDLSAKGDCNMVPRGATAILIKDSQLQNRKQALGMAKDPITMSIIGIRGYAELLRETYKMLEVPVDKIVPSDEVLIQREKAAAQAQQNGAMNAIAADHAAERAVKLSQQKTQRDLKAATIQKDLSVEAIKHGQPIPQSLTLPAETALGMTTDPSEIPPQRGSEANPASSP